jgi:hypothetical protein
MARNIIAAFDCVRVRRRNVYLPAVLYPTLILSDLKDFYRRDLLQTPIDFALPNSGGMTSQNLERLKLGTASPLYYQSYP